MEPSQAAPGLAACSTIAWRCTYFNVRKATRLLGEVYDRALRPHGLLGTQFSLLVALALEQDAPVGRVAEALGADPTTLSRAVTPLERAGLVTSTRGEDRRQRRLRLSAAGRERLAGAIPAWERAQRSVEEALGEDAWQGLVQGARAVHALAHEGALAPPGSDGPEDRGATGGAQRS